jgi:hypothetical protein
MTGLSIFDSIRPIESTSAPAIVRFNQPALEMEAANTSFENGFDVFISITVPFILFITETAFIL